MSIPDEASGLNTFHMFEAGGLRPSMLDHGHAAYVAAAFGLPAEGPVFRSILAELQADASGTSPIAVAYEDVVWNAAEQERKIRELQESVTHDSLTGLLNNRGWKLAATLAIKEADAEGDDTAELNIDINRFKGVNDKYGHDAGDNLIRAVGRFLQDKTRSEKRPGQPVDLVGIQNTPSPVGRLGGDEFGILLRFPKKHPDQYAGGPEHRRGQANLTSAQKARVVADRLTRLARLDARNPEHTGIGRSLPEKTRYARLGIGLSIGVAVRKAGDQRMGLHEMHLLADEDMRRIKDEQAQAREAQMPFRFRMFLRIGRLLLNKAGGYDRRLHG
jgi:GGDEF domain-containing protein